MCRGVPFMSCFVGNRKNRQDYNNSTVRIVYVSQKKNTEQSNTNNRTHSPNSSKANSLSVSPVPQVIDYEAQEPL